MRHNVTRFRGVEHVHSHNARTQQATVVVVLGVVLVDVLRPVLIMDALFSAHAVPKVVVSEVSG